ncbi:MAG: peptidoglycan-binding domain-containing protein [Candidatus Liptonbacteria bacterium]
MKKSHFILIAVALGVLALPGASFAAVQLSQTNISLNSGQSTVIYANGAVGTIFISNIQNQTVANFSVYGNQVTVTGNNSGYTSAMVCDQSGTSNCPYLYVTVGSGNSSVYFGQNNVYLTSGQSMTVSISGGYGSYYISSNSNPNVVQASISGSSVWLAANGTNGYSSITVCSSSASSCGTLSVNVSGYNNNYNYNYGYNYGYNGYNNYPYNYSNSSDVYAQIQALEAMLTQLKSQANSLYGYNGTYGYNGYSGTGYNGQVLGAYTYAFYSYLAPGSSGSEVTALQTRLTSLGIYSGPITGYYWTLTESAVRRYQAMHGLPQTGIVDAATRSALNAGY